MIFLRIVLFLAGATLVLYTLVSVIRTFVLPRGASDKISRFVFRSMRALFEIYNGRADSYEARDRAMALYAPFSLLTLAFAWLALIEIGYTAMYYAADLLDVSRAFLMSGSSLLTLGFAPSETLAETLLAFTEAAIGLITVALLISYLPTMYSAFSRRETSVSLLAVRAGEPPSAAELLSRYARIEGLAELTSLWRSWEVWFAELEESHTSLAPLVFFRSPQPDHSWVTAAGTMLDAAALRAAVVDMPRDPYAELMIRSGYLALGRISGFFGVRRPENPHYPTTPISISKDEFIQACEQMKLNSVPLKADLDQAWIAYAGWRVNYDLVLLALAQLTMAPYAPWSSDRGLPRQRLPRWLKWGDQPSTPVTAQVPDPQQVLE